MAHKNKIVHSFNMDGELQCVDIFQRPDGTYGFEEYRRDPEDGRGWFAIGHFGEAKFALSTEALSDAKTRIHWLAAVVEKPHKS